MNRKQYLLLVALTVVAGLVGGALSSWIFTGKTAAAQDIPEVITAKEFRVVDEDGKVCITLGKGPADESDVGLWISQLGSWASLSIKYGNPHLTLLETSTGETSWCSVSDTGLFCMGNKGHIRLGTDQENATSQLYIGNFGNTNAIRLFTDPKGYKKMMFIDQNSVSRAVCVLDPNGHPVLSLYDENGIIRAALGCTNLVTKTTGSTERLSESSLVLFDKEGNVLRQIPGY